MLLLFMLLLSHLFLFVFLAPRLAILDDHKRVDQGEVVREDLAHVKGYVEVLNTFDRLSSLSVLFQVELL